MTSHADLLGYNCSQCHQSFSSHAYLANHIQVVHNPVEAERRPFQCAVCGFRCVTRSNLRSHQLVHSDAKPHVCPHPDCNKRFKRKSDAKSHFRIVHSQRRRLLLKCHRCDREPFKSKAGLRQHCRNKHPDLSIQYSEVQQQATEHDGALILTQAASLLDTVDNVLANQRRKVSDDTAASEAAAAAAHSSVILNGTAGSGGPADHCPDPILLVARSLFQQASQKPVDNTITTQVCEATAIARQLLAAIPALGAIHPDAYLLLTSIIAPPSQNTSLDQSNVSPTHLKQLNNGVCRLEQVEQTTPEMFEMLDRLECQHMECLGGNDATAECARLFAAHAQAPNALSPVIPGLIQPVEIQQAHAAVRWAIKHAGYARHKPNSLPHLCSDNMVRHNTKTLFRVLCEQRDQQSRNSGREPSKSQISEVRNFPQFELVANETVEAIAAVLSQRPPHQADFEAMPCHFSEVLQTCAVDENSSFTVGRRAVPVEIAQVVRQFTSISTAIRQHGLNSQTTLTLTQAVAELGKSAVWPLLGHDSKVAILHSSFEQPSSIEEARQACPRKVWCFSNRTAEKLFGRSQAEICQMRDRGALPFFLPFLHEDDWHLGSQLIMGWIQFVSCNPVQPGQIGLFEHSGCVMRANTKFGGPIRCHFILQMQYDHNSVHRGVTWIIRPLKKAVETVFINDDDDDDDDDDEEEHS